MRLGLASVSTLCVLLAPRVVGALAPAAARPRVITDVIHRSITLHPLCVQIVDTPEFQRLRGISQLGTVQWVFPCARHDRFQHALGVSHLASEWARQFQREQPELHISDQEVLCVTVAGLVHDLGHGPFSHFWEGSFLPAVAAADPSTRASMPPKHEEISCRLLDRLLEGIDLSPWLEVPLHTELIKALVRGEPDAYAPEKSFLFDIVANPRSGLDVDKIDYYQRDSYYSGVTKVSFDAVRLMRLARVAEADGQLQICFPHKCVNEVLRVFSTRFDLHQELYQHRVGAAVGYMVRDALQHASAKLRVVGEDGVLLRLHECGSLALDGRCEGYLQLTDAVLALAEAEARRAAVTEAREGGAMGGAEGAVGDAGAEGDAEEMRRAGALLQRLQRRDLYRFVGTVQLSPAADDQPAPDAGLLKGTPAALKAVASEIVQIACDLGGAGALRAEDLIVDLRRVSYGCRSDNPLQRIRWYDAKQAQGEGEGEYLRARRLPVETRAATPRAFEEVSLRVFLTAPDAGGLDGARAAFRLWSERNEVCDEIDVTHLGSLYLNDNVDARGAAEEGQAGAAGDIAMLTVPQLKERLRAAGRKVGGNKAELVERLHEHEG